MLEIRNTSTITKTFGLPISRTSYADVTLKDLPPPLPPTPTPHPYLRGTLARWQWVTLCSSISLLKKDVLRSMELYMSELDDKGKPKIAVGFAGEMVADHCSKIFLCGTVNERA